jgi:hypothetical protein
LIRRARYILAAAGSAAILAGGMALAGAGAASANTVPACLTTGANCTSSAYGTAGYYGADDNHTHYRFVQTVTVATPQLVNLNGTGDNEGAVGVSLCDPNTGQAAMLSLGFNGVNYQVAYDVGRYFTDTAEPCVQNIFKFINPFKSGHLLTFPGVNPGDKMYLAIYYTPGGHHFHQISFGACDITQSVCRQAYSNSRVSLEFWEFGIGAFSQRQFLTAPALNGLDNFSSNNVTCYSCAGAVPITAVGPVNPFNIGGLYEAQFVNGSSQVTMSPNDTLNYATDAFNVYNGSTSP